MKSVPSALGQVLPVVTARDFFGLATCYADLEGRDRPIVLKNST